MSQIGKEVGGFELEDCSHFLLGGLFIEDGRWQSFSACICTFPYLLPVAFWFKFTACCELVRPLHQFKMDHVNAIRP